MTDLELLWAMLLAGGTGCHVLQLDERGHKPVLFLDVQHRERFTRRLEAFSYEFDPMLSAAPAPKKGDARYRVDPSVLWAHCESGRSCARLRAFRPMPTIVLKSGANVRQTALWALRGTLSLEWVVRANRRLAHRLGTKKLHAEADFAFRPPGAIDRSNCKPVPVIAERTDEAYSARQVVGHLPDAPDPDAWRERHG